MIGLTARSLPIWRNPAPRQHPCRRQRAAFGTDRKRIRYSTPLHDAAPLPLSRGQQVRQQADALIPSGAVAFRKTLTP